MRLGSFATRLAGGVALVLVVLVGGHFAMAAIAGRTQSVATPANAQIAVASNAPALLPVAETLPVITVALPTQSAPNDVGPAPTAETERACISQQEAYRVISATTEGERIEDIQAALSAIAAHPEGTADAALESVLTQRLRRALNLNGSAPVCASVRLALTEAVHLAQVASAADAEADTGAVGEPSPLSPVAYSYVPPGTPSGAGGWGYRVGRD